MRVAAIAFSSARPCLSLNLIYFSVAVICTSMASMDKEESESPSKDQSANAITSDDCHLRDDCVHSREEFVDNHEKYNRNQRTCCENELHFSEPANVLDTMETDLIVPVIGIDNKCVNSSSDSQVRHSLKASNQPNEDNDVGDNGDLRLKGSDNNSDDEYQSADEGDGDYDNYTDGDQEDKEDRFVLLENKDNYAGEKGNDSDAANEESEEQETEPAIIDDLEVRKSMEEKLTEDEKKVSGN